MGSGKVSGSPPSIVLCYEVGYDAFWLARFLIARGINCLVLDPGSLEVKRRPRRVKTDRVNLKKLLRTLSAWRRGERHVWSLSRVATVEQQIDAIEKERDTAPTTCKETEKKRHLLLQLKSIGPANTALLSREVYYRHFDNQRQIGSFLGLTPSPFKSGEEERCQGMSRAGSGRVRAVMIEAAWLWVRHQPKSALTCNAELRSILSARVTAKAR
jgi:transposase